MPRPGFVCAPLARAFAARCAEPMAHDLRQFTLAASASSSRSGSFLPLNRNLVSRGAQLFEPSASELEPRRPFLRNDRDDVGQARPSGDAALETPSSNPAFEKSMRWRRPANLPRPSSPPKGFQSAPSARTRRMKSMTLRDGSMACCHVCASPSFSPKCMAGQALPIDSVICGRERRPSIASR